MINKLINGISEAIFKKFGSDYEIYTESVEQGLHEPCFSITCINPTNELFRNKKYFRKNQFCIHYFPSSQDKKEECNIVIEKLYDCLECIEVENNGKTRGSNMESEYSDGVLNFFVNFDMFVVKTEQSEKMDSYISETDVKG